MTHACIMNMIPLVWPEFMKLFFSELWILLYIIMSSFHHFSYFWCITFYNFKLKSNKWQKSILMIVSCWTCINHSSPTVYLQYLFRVTLEIGWSWIWCLVPKMTMHFLIEMTCIIHLFWLWLSYKFWTIIVLKIKSFLTASAKTNAAYG